MQMQFLNLLIAGMYVGLALAVTVFAAAHGVPAIRYGLALFFIVEAVVIAKDVRGAHLLNIFICSVAGLGFLVSLLYPYSHVEIEHAGEWKSLASDCAFLAAFFVAGIFSAVRLSKRNSHA